MLSDVRGHPFLHLHPFIFIEQEEKNGSFKVWGNSVIAMRVYSEKTAQRLIDYENLKG